MKSVENEKVQNRNTRIGLMERVAFNVVPKFGTQMCQLG